MDKSVAPPATPEMDPELAEMEHERHTHVNAGKDPQRSITERVLSKLGVRGHKGTPPRSQGPQRDRKRGKVPNESRWRRRAMGRIGNDPDPRTQPHARLGRAKPIVSERERVYRYKTEVRQALSKIRVVSLVMECPEMKFVAGVPGLRTVWQLSQAPTAWIHSIPGLGEKRRKKIHAYLTGKQVPVAWTP